MQLTTELIAIAVTMAAHFVHSIRRAATIEAKVDAIAEHTRQIPHLDRRLSRVEGRMNGSHLERDE